MRRLDDDEWGPSDADDWFAEPRPPRTEPYERSMDVEPAAPPAPPSDDELRRRRLLALAGLAAAVVLIVGGVLVARAVGGDDEPADTVAVPPPPPPALTTTTTTTPTTPATPPPASPPSAQPIVLPEGVRLSVGSEGEDVVPVQEALARLGYEVGEADGIYGESTQAAVVAFQEAQGLTADGIVGAETLAALQAALDAG